MNKPHHLIRLSLLAAILAITFTTHAQVPQIINYQGRIAVDAVNFDGTGQFRFALVNATGTTSYWSNDGTSTGGSQPTTAVALTVTKGLYSVQLGDASLANMTAIPNSVFANSDVRLRVWFNDGTNGSQLLTPDQRLTAVGYAMVAGGLNLPTTTSSAMGVILQNGGPLMHSFGTDNFFGGASAGNFVMTGNGNTGSGANALAANTSGSNNTASGKDSLRNTTAGSGNTAVGVNALKTNATGNSNTATGKDSLLNNVGGSNSAFGASALRGNTSGVDNTANGRDALNANTTGNGNTASGTAALLNNTTGSNNTASGYFALAANTTGTNNIAVGKNAGNLLTTGSNNIAIGHTGVAGESNVIRIGTSQTDTFLAGVIHGDGSGLTGISGGTGGGVPNGMQEFDTPGTFNFTVPAGVTKLMVEAWGAGGGGGGSYNSSSPYVMNDGGFGGWGAFSKHVIGVTAGASYTVVVGAKGLGGTDGLSPSAGNPGGSTQFKTAGGTVLLESGGGSGGTAASSVAFGVHGNGGVADPAAMIKRNGGSGYNGSVVSGTVSPPPDPATQMIGSSGGSVYYPGHPGGRGFMVISW